MEQEKKVQVLFFASCNHEEVYCPPLENQHGREKCTLSIDGVEETINLHGDTLTKITIEKES